MKQMTMFSNGEDLPLISRTLPRAKEQVFKPARVQVQPRLFEVNCNLCLDTGTIDGTRCICQKILKGGDARE